MRQMRKVSDVPGQRPVQQAKGAKRVPRTDGRPGTGRYFPPYAPEPDPAGARQGSFRRAAGNRLCGGAEEVRGPVNAMLREEGIRLWRRTTAQLADCASFHTLLQRAGVNPRKRLGRPCLGIRL